MIFFDSENNLFSLDTVDSTYVIRVYNKNILMHAYYGARIPHDNITYRNLFSTGEYDPERVIDGSNLWMGMFPQEYPTFGFGDMRKPAVRVQGADGRTNTDLRYISHKIIPGKPHIENMPQLEADVQDADTLEITLQDVLNGIEVVLSYSVFEKENIIARHTTIKNISGKAVKLLSAASMSLDIDPGKRDMVTLEGAWARERSIERYPLHHGTSSVESRRGSSGHQLNPFAAFASCNADEDNGEIYAVALVYSGDFSISAEVEFEGSARVIAGINPDTFTWMLEDNESFTTPEALITYSAHGFNEMSHNFHDVCRNHLGRSADKTLNHPIIINNWEAMYLDLTEEKMRDFIVSCRGMGIDTVVMDDGWFGHRNTVHSSLGDWFVDEQKFPNGLDGVIKCCHDNNMKFGIWFEPEMISRNSMLFKEHPDWCIHTSGRDPLESRFQLVLDMSRPEVVDNIYNQITAILNRYDISYIKWDLNRYMTDNGSESLPPERQGEHTHRYVLGVYSLMQRLIEKFPKVFFEGCASGGGRFDFGILYYMSQIWTSDNSDAISRLRIQYGTSLVYPPASMVAHVSACPNHQTGRVESFSTRGDIAQDFSFGYELNIGLLSDDEKIQITQQTAKHRELEDMINSGDFYRLLSPFEGDCSAWQSVSKDKNRSHVVYAQQFMTPNSRNKVFLRVKGLDTKKYYRIPQLNIVVSGGTLMNAGIPVIPPDSDYVTITFDLISV